MRETRGGKYGRFLASWINYTISRIPRSKREDYKLRFSKELENYSFKERPKGSPRNEGGLWELVNIDDPLFSDPIIFARTVKEGIHLMYQKSTARRVFRSLLENLNP